MAKNRTPSTKDSGELLGLESQRTLSLAEDLPVLAEGWIEDVWEQVESYDEMIEAVDDTLGLGKKDRTLLRQEIRRLEKQEVICVSCEQLRFYNEKDNRYFCPVCNL